MAFTAVADKPLIVDVGHGGDPGTLSVTFNGVAMTQIWTANDGTWDWSSQWYLANPSAGTFNIVVTAAGGTNVTVAAIQYDGVNMLNPYGTPVIAGSRADNVPTTGAIASDANSIVIGTAFTDDQAGISVTGGGTQLYEIENVSGDDSFSGQYKAGAASVTLSWTGINNLNVGWACGGVSLHGLSVSAAVTGTLNGSTEADVRSGGKTIVLTLTGDTFIPS